jgi:hypothetical protein
MQLSQILVYTKRTRFDFKFKKLSNIPFWNEDGELVCDDKSKNEQNMFDKLHNKLFATAGDQKEVNAKKLLKHKYTAFLRQSNVVKHVYKDDDKNLRVIFAYCDQDIQHKGDLNLLGHIYKKDLESAAPIEMRYFMKIFTINQQNQVGSANRIMQGIN